MLTVIPFHGGGKTRLPDELRREVALAMLGDVVAAAIEVGDVRVVTADAEAGLVASRLAATVIADPGGGQGAAVSTGLAGAEGTCLVVNADVPLARPSDLYALAVPPRLGKLGIVEAADGTTNALGLPGAEAFADLYGEGSATRFRMHAVALGLEVDDVALPNLADDVDTLADLMRVGPLAGVRTSALLEVAAR